MSRICSKSTAKITYLHNALGQRVFKSEPQIAQTAPSEEELGPDFVAWLKKNYAWMFDKTQSNATVGQSYVYADGALPEYALLAEYGNGAASGSNRLEYIWLPTDSGAIPIGLFKSNRLYSIHSDHLNTPRLVKDDDAKPVWQWPYSAFGDNKPTGILKATTTPNNAITQDQATSTQLKATAPTLKLNLRYPGQYFDEESNLNYNYNRSYMFGQGRYSQADPIGLDGGMNRFGYVGGNALSGVDPKGLVKWSGEMYSLIAINIGGGGQFWFDLKSECVNGKYAYIRVYASAIGIGLGAKYTGGASAISFDDHLSSINPEGFSGTFKMASAGIGVGLTGGYSAIQLGKNVADFSATPSPGIGFDFSISGLIGRSNLLSTEYKDCNCN